jgi:hypothetical protein
VETIEVPVGIVPWPQDGDPGQREDPEHGGNGRDDPPRVRRERSVPGSVVMGVTHSFQSPRSAPLQE